MKKFVARNIVVSSSTPLNEKIHCCPRCLKAHAIKMAEEMNFLHVNKTIKRLIKGEVGHDGYYLDQDELIRI
ncbi:hypothetical protein KW787_01745 [Candidatus Pacearchaeota archaeon]|nr:hypothetical protein [Candidatus Pacearchaeota archaeon]